MAAFVLDNRCNTTVKIAHRVVNAHNVRARNGGVRQKSAFNDAVIQQIFYVGLTVKAAEGFGNPHFDKFTQHLWYDSLHTRKNSEL